MKRCGEYRGVKKLIAAVVLAGCIGIIASCEKIMPEAISDNEVLDGPVNGLTSSELATFMRGDAAFKQTFTAETGLGPVFVATSCASCHAGDGKGHPFTSLVRFGQTDSTGNHFLLNGGPQLQNRALPGYKPETLPAGATFATFMPPANTGLGFIERVSDADILSMADPDDTDGDGISGVPNWKPLPAYLSAHPNAISKNGKYICRLGKKSGAYTLLHQTVNAYNQDMGITSFWEPRDVFTGNEQDDEVSAQTVNDVVFYLQTLKAPAQRNPEDATVKAGKEVFMQTGCASCHKPALKTSSSPVEALSNKEFYPYTDLLLHDMGPGLDDGYTEGSAKTSEWRTPALWGLGLSPKSQGGSYFLMHDGRAKSIEEAILLHGGEGAKSNHAYQQLTPAQKDALLTFLKSL